MKRQFIIGSIIAALSCAATLSATAGVTARYTFDDDGNNGLNLLKASVGSDAWVLVGAKPAADGEGICGLYATNGQGRVDGKGAVAVPKGELLAIPHGLTKAEGQAWFMRLKVFMPYEERHTILSFSQNNWGDGYLFQSSTQSLGGSDGWGTYYYVTGTPMIGNWKTILLNCDGTGTDLYVNDVKVLRTKEGAPPMRTKVKRVKSLWRFPHPVPKCLIYVSLLFAVKADGPACSL